MAAARASSDAKAEQMHTAKVMARWYVEDRKMRAGTIMSDQVASRNIDQANRCRVIGSFVVCDRSASMPKRTACLNRRQLGAGRGISLEQHNAPLVICEGLKPTISIRTCEQVDRVP
jgi:hypothetical protein